jgi:hypothetical protein
MIKNHCLVSVQNCATKFASRNTELPITSIDALGSVAYTLSLRCRLSSYLFGLI